MSTDSTTEPRVRRTTAKRQRSRGQILVIFAGAIFLMMMLMAIVIDVSWYWVNSLRAQRAADAAALAGAVMLPQQVGSAYTLARAEATKNGFTQGVNGVTEVFPQQDGGNPRRLNVRIQARIGTFFMRVIGIPQIPIVRYSTAEFTPPVPMGSPQNYYGVGILNVPTTSQVTHNDDTDWRNTNDTPNNSGTWTSTNDVDDNDGQYGFSTTANNSSQQWWNFGLQGGNGGLPNDNTLAILGLEVRLRDRLYNQGSNLGSSADCRLQVEVSTNGGQSWGGPVPPNPAPQTTAPLSTSTTDRVDTFGATNSLAVWGNQTWNRNGFSDTNFRVRLTFLKASGATCGPNRRAMVDQIEVRVTYRWVETIINPPTPQPVTGPHGGVLAPQKFWGAMQSQGAPSIQGDAYMTGYTTRKSAGNPNYHPVQGYGGSPQEFYNYGIELPGGSGEVWIYDPGFCDTGIYQNGNTILNQGTGESWTVTNSNTGDIGANPARPVSAQYTLYGLNNTPYEYGDDPVAAPPMTYRRLMMSDQSLGGGSGGDYPNVQSCTNASWHNHWVQLAGGLPAGNYRLHTTSRIYNTTSKAVDGSDDQTDSAGLNAFAIWVSSNGPNPRVYGLGAMESYFPLPGNQTSVFYLAQLEAVHAGKWVDIDLWDPGDTGDLSAVLRILAPDGGAGTVQRFYWNAVTGTTRPANFQCGPTTSSQVSSITTSTGNGGIFNGRWLRICFQLLDTYSAPLDPTYHQPGWWRISYQMSGTGASTDLTTWEVNVRGNPVHLVLP